MSANTRRRCHIILKPNRANRNGSRVGRLSSLPLFPLLMLINSSIRRHPSSIPLDILPLSYSIRSAFIGSTLAARRAGMIPATPESTSSSAITPNKTAGSWLEIP